VGQVRGAQGSQELGRQPPALTAAGEGDPAHQGGGKREGARGLCGYTARFWGRRLVLEVRAWWQSSAQQPQHTRHAVAHTAASMTQLLPSLWAGDGVPPGGTAAHLL
jgi:hypothetical protein